MCIISGLREELLDSSILVAAMSSLFESVSGLHGGLVLRNSAARTATHRRFGSARAVLHCCRSSATGAVCILGRVNRAAALFLVHSQGAI